MHIVSFLRKLVFLVIWLAFLFTIVPFLFLLLAAYPAEIPFFVKHQFIAYVIVGLFLAISFVLIIYITVFLIKRLFKSKNKSQGGE